MFGLSRAEIAERRLLEFEHERRRQRPIGFEEIEALRERGRIAKRRRGDIAEYSDVLVAHHQPAQHLHAFQHHGVIDPPDQPGSLRDRNEVVGGEKLVPVVAQPRHRLVKAHLALRQRHHRLQENVDPVFLHRASHGSEDLRLAAARRGLIGDRSGRCRGGLGRNRSIFGAKRPLPVRFIVRFVRRRRRSR